MNETVKCECGKEENINDAQIDTDGTWHCKSCLDELWNIKTYRCGNCGTPTDKDGHTLSIDECNELTEQQLNEAELVCGYCCIEELNQVNDIIVTRDMAIDAQDLSLEGERWRW